MSLKVYQTNEKEGFGEKRLKTTTTGERWTNITYYCMPDGMLKKEK